MKFPDYESYRKMQAEVRGNWLYIYSGRDFEIKNPDMNEVGVEDPFLLVQCVRIDKITSVKVDNDHMNHNITIYVDGMTYPIHCTFGTSNCHRINAFSQFLEKIQGPLQLSTEYLYNLKRRSEVTALCSRRMDELREGGVGWGDGTLERLEKERQTAQLLAERGLTEGVGELEGNRHPEGGEHE